MTCLWLEGRERGHSPAEAPQDKPKPTVRVQADGHFSRRVELTLQLNGPAEGTGGGVTHLQDSGAQSTSGQGTMWPGYALISLPILYESSTRMTPWPLGRSNSSS